MKKFVIFILLIAFSACGQKQGGESGLLPDDMMGDMDMGLQHIFLVMLDGLSEEQKYYNDYFLSQATIAAQQFGFSLVFESYTPVTYNVTDESSGSRTYTAADVNRQNTSWADQIIELEALHPGSIFITTPEVSRILRDRSLLGDFYDSALTHAPNYMSMLYSLNEPSHFYTMPTSTSWSIDRLYVLIKNDVYEDYGKDVRDANELEDLMKWLKSSNPVMAPCYFYFPGSLANDVIDIFFPAKNYQSLERMLLDYLPDRTYYINTLLWLDKNNGELKSLYDMENNLNDAIRRYELWLNEGLIHMGEDYTDLGAEVLDNPVIFTDLNGAYSFGRELEGYSINIFPEPNKDRITINYAAVGFAETNAGEFLSFMEWLTEDEENYALFIDETTHSGTATVTDPSHIDTMQAAAIFFNRNFYQYQWDRNNFFEMYIRADNIRDEIIALQMPEYPVEGGDLHEIAKFVYENDLKSDFDTIQNLFFWQLNTYMDSIKNRTMGDPEISPFVLDTSGFDTAKHQEFVDMVGGALGN